jgi:hypothetical protein
MKFNQRLVNYAKESKKKQREKKKAAKVVEVSQPVRLGPDVYCGV